MLNLLRLDANHARDGPFSKMDPPTQKEANQASSWRATKEWWSKPHRGFPSLQRTTKQNMKPLLKASLLINLVLGAREVKTRKKIIS